MRAGLLSDPRVIALLGTEFVPCILSALNTPQCHHDPRDVALLRSFVRPGGEAFVGGEREAFVLPDGTMQDVFLSLSATDGGERLHGTAQGRRSPHASSVFRRHAAAALRAVHGRLPESWDAIWLGTAPSVVAAAAAAPRWPLPPAGERALRCFVRNGALRYDELNGCELVAMPAMDDRLAAGARPGTVVELPAALFRSLVRALVPRGGVDTRLADASIDGALRCHVEQIDGATCRGSVTGRFDMHPKDRREVATRENAGSLFTARGSFTGRFAFDRGTRRLTELRVVARDVAFEWLPRWQRAGEPSWLRAAFELVVAPAPSAVDPARQPEGR